MARGSTITGASSSCCQRNDARLSAGSVTSQNRAVAGAFEHDEVPSLAVAGARGPAGGVEHAVEHLALDGARVEGPDHAPRSKQLGELHRGASGPGAYREPSFKRSSAMAQPKATSTSPLAGRSPLKSASTSGGTVSGLSDSWSNRPLVLPLTWKLCSS